jgi:hypothetical protein
VPLHIRKSSRPWSSMGTKQEQQTVEFHGTPALVLPTHPLSASGWLCAHGRPCSRLFVTPGPPSPPPLPPLLPAELRLLLLLLCDSEPLWAQGQGAGFAGVGAWSSAQSAKE